MAFGGPRPDVVLTDEQRRQIRQAAEQAYDTLRWIVGDHRELRSELECLARDSFREGMAWRSESRQQKPRADALAATVRG
jgi:hypothetical protein